MRQKFREYSAEPPVSMLTWSVWDGKWEKAQIQAVLLRDTLCVVTLPEYREQS